MKISNSINLLLFYIALTSLVFFPGGYYRVDQFVFFFFFVIAFLKGNLVEIREIRWELFFFFLLILTTSTGISVKLFSGGQFVWRDFMSIFRDLFYLIVFLGVFQNLKSNLIKINLSYFFLILAVLCSLVSFFQYFNILGLNTYFVDIYRESDTWLIDMVSWRRIFGTIGNPNYWGLLIGQILIVLTYLLFWEGKLLVLPIILTTFASLIFTGSRSALISYCLAVFFGFLTIAILRKEKYKIIIFLVTLSISVPILLTIVNYSGYEEMDRFSTSNIGSYYGRIQRWNSILQTNPLILFVGAGPTKGLQTAWVDNTYLKILYEQGVTGLFCFLGLLATFLFRFLKDIRDNDDMRWSAILMIVIIHWMVFALSADIWSHVRCTPIFLGLISYTYASIYAKKNFKIMGQEKQC